MVLEPEPTEDPRSLKEVINTRLLKMAFVAIVVLSVLVLGSLVVNIIVIRNETQAARQRDRVIAKLDRVINTQTVQFRGHRERNEDIHSCGIIKQDIFRKDIATFLAQQAAGQHPGFSADDGVVCPPIDPVTGNTIQSPYSSSTTSTTQRGGPG